MLDKENKRRTVVLLLMVLSVLNVFAQLSSRGKDTPTLTTDRLSPGLEYKLIFNDEFNQPDGTLPDTSVWKSCRRRPKVTWARYLSNSPEVAFIRDGKLILRAIPNSNKSSTGEEMLTGGIETSHSFAFRYGRVECRARVNPFDGNFPAIWMMPRTTLPWPQGGEIDIFEQIDQEQRAYSTVHSAWTRSHGNLPHSGNIELDMSLFHTYAVEWAPGILTFFADGKQVYQYKKEPDNPEQWPFDKSDFYLILNQSVGDGSWAKPVDTTHTYQMEIDWIRVYQRDKTNINKRK